MIHLILSHTTDNGTGDNTFSFTNPMGNANYVSSTQLVSCKCTTDILSLVD